MNFPRASPLATPPDTRYVPPALESVDPMRRGGREVECTALEMRHTCKGIVGSNPTLSAIIARYFGSRQAPPNGSAAPDLMFGFVHRYLPIGLTS